MSVSAVKDDLDLDHDGDGDCSDDDDDMDVDYSDRQWLMEQSSAAHDNPNDSEEDYSVPRQSRAFFITKFWKILAAIAVTSLGVGITARPLYNNNHSVPPLNHFISNDYTTMTENVQFLMDFAIIGHSKTATSFLLKWLNHHQQVLVHDRELYFLRDEVEGPARMTQAMYNLGHIDQDKVHYYRRGYKAANDIKRLEALAALRRYWPQTRLIIGVRHPVQWFESFYNYNVRRFQSGQSTIVMPPAEQLIGKNLPGHVFYHHHLAMFGKTNLSNPDEQSLLHNIERGFLVSKHKNTLPESYYPPIRMPNPVFLYDVSQPFVHDNDGGDAYSLTQQFAVDLQTFLGLDKPLRPSNDIMTLREKFLVRIGRKKVRVGSNFHYAIDVCEAKYDPLRKELLETGAEAALWITEYFLKQPDVYVSSPDHFRELLQTWRVDPCANSTIFRRLAEERLWAI